MNWVLRNRYTTFCTFVRVKTILSCKPPPHPLQWKTPAFFNIQTEQIFDSICKGFLLNIPFINENNSYSHFFCVSTLSTISPQLSPQPKKFSTFLHSFSTTPHTINRIFTFVLTPVLFYIFVLIQVHTQHPNTTNTIYNVYIH